MDKINAPIDSTRTETKLGDISQMDLPNKQTNMSNFYVDSHISQYPPSILAMASMAVAIDGLSTTEKNCWHLNEIVTQIHESTNKVNDVSSTGQD